MYINIVANVLHLHLQLQQNINGNKYNFKNIIIPLSYHSFKVYGLFLHSFQYYTFQFVLIIYTVISESSWYIL